MRKTRKKRTCWFIEPLNAKVNRLVFQNIPEAETQSDLPSSDGKPHDLLEVPRRKLRIFLTLEAVRDLRFKIFVRTGNSKVKPWLFEDSVKSSQKSTTRRIGVERVPSEKGTPPANAMRAKE